MIGLGFFSTIPFKQQIYPPTHHRTMTDCMCCGQEDDAAGLFMANRINPAARRVCNICARTHGLNLPRNSALLVAYDRGNPSIAREQGTIAAGLGPT